MKVLDLFAGLGGWSKPFRDRGHDVYRVELLSTLEAECHADILEWDASGLPWSPDLVLASPPCEGFSVMNIGRNWFHDGTPKTDTARLALALVARTLDIIERLTPQWFVIENPRGKLRALPIMSHLERRTVTYCHFGEQRMKPTDLWSSRWPGQLALPPPCNNGDPCHVRAPRGSRTGTQGFGSYHEKSVIPYPLAMAVCLACEQSESVSVPSQGTLFRMEAIR